MRVPMDPNLRRGPQEDIDLYWKAQKDLKKFFPSELFIRLVTEFWTEIDKSEAYQQSMAEATEWLERELDELLKQLPGLLPAGQVTGIQGQSPPFAESECEAAQSIFIQTWIDELFHFHKDNPALECSRLNNNMWPPNVPPEYITLNRYLFSENSIPQVMTQFATNIKAAIDASPDGLVILPKNSKGIELRIKKDATGYYLA